MSAKGRPEREHRSAQREGPTTSAKGRPEREHRSAQREGPTTSAPGALVTPAYCQLLARYNRWMNERVYALCADIDDAERRRDRGAFFGSIHGTLNHLLRADRTWLGRFGGEPCTASSAEGMVVSRTPGWRRRTS